MSVRSFRRNRARAEAAESRRDSRRVRRASIAAGAAIGATVVFAPSAGAASFEVDTFADPGNGDGCLVTDCSLREAIDDAESNSEADTITFAADLDGEITLTAGDLDIYAPDGLTITDDGTNRVTISGDSNTNDTADAGDTRIFYVGPYASAGFNGLTLSEGYANDSRGKYGLSEGGAIFMAPYSDVTVTDSTLSGSSAGDIGGAIFNAYGELTVTGTEISGNSADLLGGGIFSSGAKYDGPVVRDAQSDQAPGDPATTTITDSTISGNSAEAGGGVVAMNSKYDSETAPDPASNQLTITGTTISGNDAFGAGGVLTKYSDTTVADSRIEDNTAYGIGGMGVYAGSAEITGTTLSGNEASLDGGPGGLAVGKYAQLDLSDSTITGNSGGFGGGVAFDSEPPGNEYGAYGAASSDAAPAPGTSTITQTTIAGNSVGYAGGGVAIGDVYDNAGLTIADSTISGNSVEYDGYYGGGIALYGGIYGAVTVSNSTVSGNSADIGAGISIDTPYQGPDGPPPLARSLFFDRGSSQGSDRVVGPNGSIAIENTTVASNSAADVGGGIYLGSYDTEPSMEDAPYASATIPLSSTIVADNTASGAPNDLAQISEVDQPGGFELTNSLVETPDGATLAQTPAGSSIVGSDPALGPLADNGGPTRTHLPAGTSPAIDTGLANGLTTDQRGLPRTVDANAANGAGDGTDIGSVEVQNGATPPASSTRRLERSEVPRGCTTPTYDAAELALAGDGSSQTLLGTDGDDILRGFGGQDQVLGLKGDDCLTGDDDDDVVKGGGGSDFGDGGRGVDILRGNGGKDELHGAGGDDSLRLSGGADRGIGGGGEDRVNGGAGDDTVRGRFGDDKLAGGKDDDAVRGGGGGDRINSGRGSDSIRGGGGDDRIALGGGKDEVNCGKGEDKVIGAGRNDDIGKNCEHVR